MHMLLWFLFWPISAFRAISVLWTFVRDIKNQKLSPNMRLVEVIADCWLMLSYGFLIYFAYRGIAGR